MHAQNNRLALPRRTRRIYTRGAWQMLSEGFKFLPEESAFYDYAGPVAEAANTPYQLFEQQAAGPTLTAGTAASLLVAASPAVGQVRNTIPAGWMNAVGTHIKFEATGTLSTAATPGTGTWSLYFGSTAIWNSTAITLTASMSTWPWAVELDFVVRTVGATTAATLYGVGKLFLATAANTGSWIPFSPAAGAAGFDSTVPNVLDFWFTESLGTATLITQQARAFITNPYY